MQVKPVPGRRGDISQDRRFGIDIINDHVQAAISIQIANRQSPAGPGFCERTSRRRPDTFKLSILKIAEEQGLLSKTGAPLVRVDRRIDVTVYNKEIQPRVVIKIEEARSPTEKWNR